MEVLFPALGPALRTGQCDADKQPAFLQMGADLQRSYDDRRGHRPPRASQRDPGVEPAELSAGGLKAADQHRATGSTGGLMVRGADETLIEVRGLDH